MLKTYLWKYHENIQLVNLWISGDTTKELLSHFEAFKSAYIEKYNDDTIVIFAIGTNDSYEFPNWKNQIQLEQFKNNINELIQTSKKDNQIKDVIFLWNMNVDEEFTAPVSWKEIYYTNQNIQKYNDVIKQQCEDNNIGYLNLYWTMEKSDLSDGLHPTTGGHNKIFEQVKDFLEKRL